MSGRNAGGRRYHLSSKLVNKVTDYRFRDVTNMMDAGEKKELETRSEFRAPKHFLHACDVILKDIILIQG